MPEDNTGSGDNPAPQGGDAGAGAILNVADVSGGDNPQNIEGAAPNGTDTLEGGANSGGDNPEWITGFEGEDLGWLQNRGLHSKDANEAIKNLVTAQRNAEKRLGTPADRLLTLPSDPTSEGAMDPVWNALGRPETVDGYELDAGDTDLTKQFAETLGEVFHTNGLTKDQAKAVEAGLEEFFGNQHTSTEEGTRLQQETGINALKDDWGDNYDLNVNIAREAVKAAGATLEEITALEGAFGEKGNAAVIKFFNRLGQKRGVETPFIDGDNTLLGLGATTPEAARDRMQEMKADPKVRQNILDNNPENADVKRYRALAGLASRQKAS